MATSTGVDFSIFFLSENYHVRGAAIPWPRCTVTALQLYFNLSTCILRSIPANEIQTYLHFEIPTSFTTNCIICCISCIVLLHVFLLTTLCNQFNYGQWYRSRWGEWKYRGESIGSLPRRFGCFLGSSVPRMRLRRWGAYSARPILTGENGLTAMPSWKYNVGLE